VVQHQIQCLIFASQQRNVSNFSCISNAEKLQPFSGKFLTTIQYSKPISWNVLSLHFLRDILPMTKSVILSTIMT